MLVESSQNSFSFKIDYSIYLVTTVSLFIRGSISRNSSTKPQSPVFDLLPGINFHKTSNAVVILMIDKEGCGKMGWIWPWIYYFHSNHLVRGFLKEH